MGFGSTAGSIRDIEEVSTLERVRQRRAIEAFTAGGVPRSARPKHFRRAGTCADSRLALHYADKVHSYSKIERPELKEYVVERFDLSVSDAGPDILAPTTSEDYLEGRDPAMEAIVGAK